MILGGFRSRLYSRFGLRVSGSGFRVQGLADHLAAFVLGPEFSSPRREVPKP